MSIQILQQYKARCFNQKKTISFVEKSPWYESETFKGLCKENKYCFALCFIWITHLNDSVEERDLKLKVEEINESHKANLKLDNDDPYSLEKVKLDDLKLVEGVQGGSYNYEDDIERALKEHPDKGMLYCKYNEDAVHAVSYKKKETSDAYQFLNTAEHEDPIGNFEDANALKQFMKIFYKNILDHSTGDTFLVFIYFEYISLCSEIVKRPRLN